ncbi:MAG: bifunctional oligoribonuclease/PAP phosphatase NrnA [Patescibacteria group bacterium]
METTLNTKQQVSELIKHSQKILILTHTDPDGDAIGSLLALTLILKQMGKDVTAAYGGLLSPAYSYLPLTHVTNNFVVNKDFIIKIDTENTKIDRISYRESEEKKDQLNLVITPTQGRFEAKNISFEEGKAKYDLICLLDCSEESRTGAIYRENPELFEETPIVNIDHHLTNTHFGKANLHDLNATSTCEILVSLAESLSREKNLVNAEIATCLLTGLITDTDSFQNDNTTPKSFTVAAQLVAAGADQQKIIQKVYMSKSFPVLKVWGKILSSLTEEEENFVWAKINQIELKECGADSTAVEGVNNELLRTVPESDFSLLLTEREDQKVYGSLRSINKSFNVSEVAKIFNGGGHAVASGFHIDKPFNQACEEAISSIKEYLVKLKKDTRVGENNINEI